MKAISTFGYLKTLYNSLSYHMSTTAIWCDYPCNSLRSWRDMVGRDWRFGGGAPEPRRVWEQVNLKFSHAARIPRVTIPPATQAILIITLSPVLHVQIISLSPTSLIFFFSIQSLNFMSPALWHFNNSPGVGSEVSEPPSTYRTKFSEMCPLRVERHMSVLRIR